MNTIEVTVKSQKKVARETTEVTFVRPDGFEFLAGQHLQVSLPTLNYSDHKGSSRVFSICSSPRSREDLSIAVRDTRSGHKRTLAELPRGSKVLIKGPSDFFTLPEGGKHILVAGGIGITPFMSMIEATLEKKGNYDITLLYANRNEESSSYLADLKKLNASSRHFHLYTIFGQLDAHFIQEHAADSENTTWWIAGPPGMVAEVKYTLEQLRISGAKVHSEEFVGI